MRVDNIDEDDQILSLRNMVNADIDFRTGAAVRRNGYSYFLQTLATQAKQIEEFYDIVGRSNLLLIMDDKLYWYRSSNTTLYEVKNASVSPTTSLDFTTYTHYPFLTVGDRCFFADDNGFWWVDNTSLVWENPPATPLPLCYQVGIDQLPTVGEQGEDVRLTLVDTLRHQQSVATTFVTLRNDGTTREALAQTFEVPNYYVADGIEVDLSIFGWADRAGKVVLRVETVNGAGKPSGILAFSNAVDELNLTGLDLTVGYVEFIFQDIVMFNTGTTYAIVVDGDLAYDAEFSIVPAHYVAWQSNNTDPYASGAALQKNNGTWEFIAGSDFCFKLGLGVSDGAYAYKLTGLNNTYTIESRPSAPDGVTLTTANGSCTVGNIPTSLADSQVNNIKIYRTAAADDDEDDDNYQLIDTIPIGTLTTFIDAVADVNRGALFQTTDHTRLTDRDDNLIVPRHLEWWQHRIWAVPADSDTFYYSKRLEQAGATGIAGDPAYDYYPQEASYRNDWDVNSTIVAMKVHENRLIVYTDRHDVHIFSGANQPLNPPPDLYHERIIIGEGILDYRGLVDLRGKHVFVTQDKEIKGFAGTIDMEDISDVMESVLADLTTIHAFVWNNQYMLLGDSNADGVMDTIYILDLSRRTLNPWRKYEYKNNVTVVEIKDVVLTNAGVLYAVAKVGSVYHVIQLDSGTSDGWITLENDGTAITKELKTHDIRPARRAFWQEVGIRGYYPTSTIPTYVTTCTDLTGETTTSAFDPTSSEDMLGHAHGLRMASNELSLKIESTGNEKDEIRELFVRYRL
jgi:hypothetical protein